MKMIVGFASKSNGQVSLDEVKYSIRRNFGGFQSDPTDFFKDLLLNEESQTGCAENSQIVKKLPTTNIQVIESALRAQHNPRE